MNYGVRGDGIYKANITAGALLVPESRKIADLMLRGVSKKEWTAAIEEENILQKLSVASAKRITNYIRARLKLMTPELWTMVRDGSSVTATHAAFAAAIKHCRLLGDYLDLVVREQFARLEDRLTRRMWDDFIEACKERDPSMEDFPPSTATKVRGVVHRILFEAGYIKDIRSWTLRSTQIDSAVLDYLARNGEQYVLRCIQV